MKLEKKHKIAIGITSGLILLSVTGLIYSWKKKILFWEEEEAAFTPDAEAEKKANEVAKTTGRPKITWRDDSFPLSIGSKGQNVKNLQNYLGIDDDGYFGYGTLDTWKKKTGRDKVVSESEYVPKNTTTQTATQSQPFSKGQPLFAKNKRVYIYTYPDRNYMIGYIDAYKLIGNFISLTTVPEWSKVYISSFNHKDGDYVANPKNYFVLTEVVTDKSVD